ncbi:MAG: UDP-N-acetylglucosamine--N-acetylmuramyl-(pentapeptide) pyrophosphoryl-undecaprenol N-acetylglucosamine transferase [Planctomycetota bacterium]
MADSSSAVAVKTVLLVGGGSGGHVLPNLAVAERLAEPLAAHLVLSVRPLDAKIAASSGLPHTAIPAAPLRVRPRAGLRFLRDYRRGVRATAEVIRRTDAAAVVATGGFVSGPAVAAARRVGLPVALVSLDAVPGRANRRSARQATEVFTAFPAHPDTPALPRAEVIGYPLRRRAVTAMDPADARRRYGLDPQRPTLLVFAGSQGARTINRVMALFYERETWGSSGWQALHIAGPGSDADAPPASASVRVLPYCDDMGPAWAAADAAVTRAGAGTVAEAWANAVPGVMFPYPFHRDEHQRHNAAPLVRLGGAVVLRDRIDPAENLGPLTETFASKLADDANRRAMASALRKHPPRDGAQRLADWVAAACLA